MITLDRVKKHFGGVRAVDDCSFGITLGKITALIGPNGSGKSTVFNLISRIEQETSGTVFIHERNVATKEDFEVAKDGISRTFQQVRLFNNMTMREHLLLSFNQEDEGLFKVFFTKEKNYDSSIQEVLDLVGLVKPLDTLATDLSYGQRKLLDLAIAIARPHKILLLDEPVAGVNPKLKADIKKIILTLNKRGSTVLLIEHDMNFVMDLADEVIVLDQGRVIAKGKPSLIRKNPKVLRAYLGE